MKLPNKKMPLTEFELIEKYFAKRTHKRADVIVGIGDDAAVLPMDADHELVVAMDTLVAGVHFLEETEPSDIGYKALAVNLSDLAAMSAEPAWITLALTMPKSDPVWLEKFCKGLFTLIDQYSLQLIGGDLTRGPLTITIQAHGLIPKGKSLQRCSAKVGDKIYVTGTLGGAAVGLQVLKKQISLPLDKQQDLLQSLLRPSPRIKEGIAVRDIAHSAIDISDGLAADLGHILEQSTVGAAINLNQLPTPFNLTKFMSEKQLWQFALTGGDDYELCFTAAPEMQEEIDKLAKRFRCGFSCIGVIEERTGFRLIQPDGTPFVIAEKGYQHFL